jgi:hypothetical protein
MVGAKAQHCWLAVPACVPIGLLFPKRKVLLAVGTIALLLTGGYMLYSTPPDYRAQALWNSVFVKLLPMSGNARGDLQELGLDDRLYAFSGRSAYELGTTQEQLFWRKELVRKVNFAKLALYYLKRRRSALQRLMLAIRESWDMRPPYLGNFERTAALPPLAKSKSYALWSRFKKDVGHNSAIVSCVIMVTVISIFIAARFVSQGFAFAWLLLAAALGETIVGAFADGIDFGRHLFMAQTLLDLYACFFVAAVMALARRLRLNIIKGRTASRTARDASG